jgi:hypothetical protein
VAGKLKSRLSQAGVTLRGGLDAATVKTLWKACQFEALLAIPPSRSHWCSLLPESEVLMLETASVPAHR